jgi:hypothetical protein
MKSQTNRIDEVMDALGPKYLALALDTLRLKADIGRWDSEARDKFLRRARMLLWVLRVNRGPMGEVLK